MNTIRQLKGTHAPCQRGAVAIMFGLSLLVLFGFMALVFDLGRTYVVRTELQNAADAAALAGAKDLNQRLSGTTQAITTAKAIGLQNRTKFSFNGDTGIVITDDMISVSSCPDGCTWIQASTITEETAVDKTFLRIDTSAGSSLGTLTTFFAGMAGNMTTRAYGLAVAGKYLIDITPLAMCTLQDDEAAEFGYERGVSYKVADSNPIGPGTYYWIDPMATSSGTCSGNVPDTLPFLCAGKLAFIPAVDQPVYTNTGISDPQLEALDSRFGVINNKNKCDATSAPPDTNIKEYRYDDAATGSPGVWMADPYPTQQSLTFIKKETSSRQLVPKPLADREFKDYGVLWSASRPVGKTASDTDWLGLYKGTATSYPETSPYTQTSEPFFSPGTNGKPDRRMLRLVIVDCPSSGGNCQPAMVRGVGKFFMQRKANVPSDKNIYLEFSGLDSSPNAEIRLYR